MAKSRSDSSKYESRHGGGWITPAQFLSEVMCERQAKINGEELVYRFWNIQFWKKEFSKQLRLAQKILVLYDPHIVSKALRSKEGKKIFSLGAPWLIKIIEIEQRNFKSIEVENIKEVVDLPLKKSFEQSKSIIKRIKELDNE